MSNLSCRASTQFQCSIYVPKLPTAQAYVLPQAVKSSAHGALPLVSEHAGIGHSIYGQKSAVIAHRRLRSPRVIDNFESRSSLFSSKLVIQKLDFVKK